MVKDIRLNKDQVIQYFLPEYFNENTRQWEATGAYETDLKKYRSFAAAKRHLEHAYGLKDYKRRIRIETLVVTNVEEVEFVD